MSLNWDLTACAEPSDVLWNDENKVVTKAMIFATMAVDMGQITEANADKFATRLAISQRVFGAMLSTVEDGQRKDRPLTLADVRRYIGLRTNVSLTTDAAFKAKMWRAMAQDAKYAVSREADKLAEQAKQVTQDA